MTTVETLSLATARTMMLQAQGLVTRGAWGRGRTALGHVVERLGYVQIDTIAVVERAHHHVLWTRIPEYEPEHLSDAMKRREVVEYWSHAAAIVPASSLAQCRVRMEHKARDGHWFKVDKRLLKAVLARIENEGPLQARDFVDTNKRAGWFDWSPAKKALETLFHSGKLAVSERRGFEKVYDLSERVFPQLATMQVPSESEHAEALIRSVLCAHGLANDREIAYLRKGMLAPVRRALQRMEKRGEVIRVRVSEVEHEMFRLATTTVPSRRVKAFDPEDSLRLLSPFDNMVIQRERLERWFGFAYQIECYVPEPKRVYGYFCLPIVWQGRFVARADVKADREKQVLLVRHLAHEPKAFAPGERVQFQRALKEELARYAQFNGCTEVRVLRRS